MPLDPQRRWCGSGLGALLRFPLYRRIVIVAALILGSHAMHDSFAVIRWEAAGIGPGTVGVLWSMSVAAEVVVFLFIGRPLLDRIGPAPAAMLAAAAGILRWVIMAETNFETGVEDGAVLGRAAHHPA